MPPDLRRRLALLLAAGLALVVLLQLALAAGAPLGRFAWGGAGGDGVLPDRLRLSSLAAALVLVGMSVLVLARGRVIGTSWSPRWGQVGCWLLFAQLLLNTLGNAASPSGPERVVMTPVTLVLAVLAFVLARNDRTA